jgi:hypothetical protein
MTRDDSTHLRCFRIVPTIVFTRRVLAAVRYRMGKKGTPVNVALQGGVRKATEARQEWTDPLYRIVFEVTQR